MISVAWETGVEFDESERLQASVSDDLVLSSSAGTGSPWKLDLFRMEVPGQSVLATQHRYDAEKHTSCNLKDLEKFHDISSCSFEEILSDENDGIVSTLPKTVDKFELTGKTSEKSEFELRKDSPQGDCSGTVCAQKRSRKPTQRYIEELEDSILRFSKKRQGPSSVPNNKNVGVRGCNKRCVVSIPVALTVEDDIIEAIQVPFAAVAVQKECRESEAYDLGSAADCGKLTSKPKQSYTTPRTSQTKRDDVVSDVSVKNRRERLAARQLKRGEFVTPKKRKDFINEASPKKKKDLIVEASPKTKDLIVEASPKTKDLIVEASPMTKELIVEASPKTKDLIVEASPKKKNNFIVEASPKKKNEFFAEASPKKQDKQVALAASHNKKDDCYSVSKRKKSDEDLLSSESPDEVSGRRKHHILWTTEEVENLIDGVSQFGVGKWSRIKKLHFSSSSHRTCVDLKDKWRNLLKASDVMERGNRQAGKKRHVAWRPLPEHIKDRVRELAVMNPYPKDQTKPQEVLQNNSHDEEDDSSDTSTDVTLNHYRKILRSISDN